MSKTKTNKTGKILLIIVVILLIAMSGLLLLSLMKKPTFTYQIEDNGIKLNIDNKNIFNKQFYVCVDENEDGQNSTNWNPYNNEVITLNEGVNYIHIKDEFGHIVDLQPSDYKVVSLEVNNDFYPLYPVGQNIELDMNVSSIGNINQITASSTNEDVATVENNQIICKSPGQTTITLGSDVVNKTIDITVTDLYTLPDHNSENKPFLKETICTTQEAHQLDEVLERKINEAGYQTRAGVVAAARFLALEFPYKLAYFSESGRLDPVSSLRCDGEGRYYHKGLYLSSDKFDQISSSVFGPAYWGQYFKEDTTDDHSQDDYYMSGGFTPADIGSDMYLMKRPNGLDCSGHVSWCYYNGGFDLGDLGAGAPGSHGMNELGELVMISDELLQSDRIKAGDLVGYPAHIGIVIGVDEDHIWISDANVSGLKNVCYERNVESFAQLQENPWQYFMLMDSEYIEDGNYTPMW